MKTVVTLALAMVSLCGCRTAHDVAVTSFHVIDAPASYVRRHIDPATTTTTTRVASSDVVTPGRPVELTPARPLPDSRRSTAQTRTGDRTVASTSARPTAGSANADVAARSSTPSSVRSTANQQAQFPTAKPVPGKAGYVFSPFDPSGGYVDVTGYPSGSKAKDPYSQKIFIVP